MAYSKRVHVANSIYVIGDVHGNYPKLKMALEAADYKPDDDLIFVGDVMDRGSYNGKVARFIDKLGNKAHLVQGNHERRHSELLPYYQAVVDFGVIYTDMAADVFKFYKEDVWWPETSEECRIHQCTLQEREKILKLPVDSFQTAVRRFIVYTLAWEDARLWQIISMLLKEICGPPYDAEHTLYEYFAGSKNTRSAMEKIWTNKTTQIVTTVHGQPWKEVVVTHNNPFGYSIYSTRASLGQKGNDRPTLYVFGHVPVSRVISFDDKETGCRYVDIDLSPKDVGILKII